MSVDKKTGTQFLERAVKAAQVFACVVTPLLVGWIGWLTQSSVASMGTRKDLVQMSLEVLREPRRQNDESLRRWAHAIINKNSDVALPDEAANQLSTPALQMLNDHPLLTPALAHRPPCPKVDLTRISGARVQDVAALQKDCEAKQRDLFWLQTYLNMIRGPIDPNTGGE